MDDPFLPLVLRLCFRWLSPVIPVNPRQGYSVRREPLWCNYGLILGAPQWESIPGVTFHQPGLVGLEVSLHRLDGAGLGAPGLPQLPHHPVINQPLAQIYDLNVRVFRLPQLSTGQGWQGFLAIRFYFHAY
jgi:hypothetical protein